MTSYYRSTTTMAPFCIDTEIYRDIGRNSQNPHVFRAPVGVVYRRNSAALLSRQKAGMIGLRDA